jgi:hypothetical protein
VLPAAHMACLLGGTTLHVSASPYLGLAAACAAMRGSMLSLQQPAGQSISHVALP